MDDAVRRSVSAGVTYVLAAGNDNADACRSSPARTPEAITVGATTNSDARASFSNFGGCMDIFAPGHQITAAWYTSNTDTKTISGTSMASPHVAGVAALYLGRNPNASPNDVAKALMDNATPGKVSAPGLCSPNKLAFTGFLGSVAPTSASGASQ
jgi:subtilisin family serine protease